MEEDVPLIEIVSEVKYEPAPVQVKYEPAPAQQQVAASAAQQHVAAAVHVQQQVAAQKQVASVAEPVEAKLTGPARPAPGGPAPTMQDFFVHGAEIDVVISAGENLVIKDRSLFSKGSSDPYVNVFYRDKPLYVLPTKKWAAKTQVIFKNLNPQWNQKFRLYLGSELDTQKDIVFKIWDYDQLKTDDSMGEVRIKLADLLNNSIKDQWFDVKPNTACPDAKGRLRISVSELHLLQADADAAAEKPGGKVDKASTEKKKKELEDAMRQGFDVLMKNLQEKDFEMDTWIMHLVLKNVSFKKIVKTTAGKTPSGLQTFSKNTKSMNFFSKQRVKELTILADISCCIKPASFTLMLGPPGCGKSSLLKVLAGKIAFDSGELSGDIEVNGESLGRTSRVSLAKLSNYVDQLDINIATMTVKETLQFAHHCSSTPKSTWAHPEMYDSKVDSYLKLLGLDHVANTVVGDDFLRGVSGGQKRRVTLGEMLVDERLLYCLDEVSTGLDSATTFDIFYRLRQVSNLMKFGVITSLLQPSPEVFDLFDDIMLVSEGRIAYQGPREKVMGYFYDLGFECPQALDYADFLQEVTTLGALAFARAGIDNYPVSTQEFGNRFLRSKVFNEIFEDVKRAGITKPWKDSKPMSHFGARGGWCHQFGFVLAREMSTFVQTKILFIVSFVLTLLNAVFAGVVFAKGITDKDALTTVNAFYFILMFIVFENSGAFGKYLAARAVFKKQSAANFMGSSQFILSLAIGGLPKILMNIIVLVTITYWWTGFSDSGVSYVLFLITTFFLAFCTGSYFRIIAFVSRDEPGAMFLANLSALVFALFSGFMLKVSDMYTIIYVIYLLNPLAWALRGAAFCVFTYWEKEAGSAALDMFRFRVMCYDGEKCFDLMWVYYGFIFMGITGILFDFVAMWCLDHVDVSSPKPPKDEAKFNPFALKENAIQMESLAFTPLTISWTALTYTVTLPDKKQKVLLSNVNGYCKAGTMTALMGESGAGKTTLLDVIAVRKTGGKIDGEFFLNGKKVNQATIGPKVSYVEQTNLQYPTAKVAEAVLFSAALRLPASMSNYERQTFSNQILDLLELTSIGHKAVSSLSSEQNKRLTIAVELVANKSLLFLDEPTSGLDSKAAMVVARVCRKIATTQRTIICTIHQPSTGIFALFDNLLFLQKGGKTVYFGPLGPLGMYVRDYLAATPGAEQPQEKENPANYMLDVVATGSEKKPPTIYWELFLESQYYRDAIVQLEAFQMDPKPLGEDVALVGFYAKLTNLLDRRFRHYWRTPTYTFNKNLLFLMFTIVVAIVFNGVAPVRTFRALSTCLALFFFSMLAPAVLGYNSVISVVIADRGVFYRERSSNYYSNLHYLLVNGLVEWPWALLNMVFYVPIFYFGMGLSAEAGRFFSFALVLLLQGVGFAFFGQWLALAVGDPGLPYLFGATAFNIFNTFCGFMAPVNQMSAFGVAMYYISPLRYALEGMVVSQFGCVHDFSNYTALDNSTTFIEGVNLLKCARIGQTVPKGLFTDFHCDPCAGCPAIEWQGNCVSTWSWLSWYYSYDVNSFGRNVAVLFGFVYIWRLLHFLTAAKVSHINR